VLDEADKLFEMGLLAQIDAVFAACTSQSLLRALFSATLPQVVEQTARTVLRDPVRLVVGSTHSASSLVEQKLVRDLEIP